MADGRSDVLTGLRGGDSEGRGRRRSGSRVRIRSRDRRRPARRGGSRRRSRSRGRSLSSRRTPSPKGQTKSEQVTPAKRPLSSHSDVCNAVFVTLSKWAESAAGLTGVADVVADLEAAGVKTVGQLVNTPARIVLEWLGLGNAATPEEVTKASNVQSVCMAVTMWLQRTSMSPEVSIQQTEAPVSAELVTALNDLVRTTQKIGRKGDGVVRGKGESDEEDAFDLASSRRKSRLLSAVEVDWFAESRRMLHLEKWVEKGKRSNPGGTSNIASVTFETWVPSWLGVDKSPADRVKLRSEWTKGAGTESVKMLSSVATFWLSHAAVGACAPESAMVHMLVLLRMLSERGLQFAVAYERRLAVYVENKGREKSSKSLDDMLSGEVESIVRELDMRSRAHFQTGHEVKLRPRAQSPKTKPLQDRRHDRSDKKSEEDKRRADPPVKPKDVSKEVCFAHDSRESKSCPLGSKCPRVHLDTAKAEEAGRYDKALSAFRQNGRGGGRGRGRGRGSL